jgi:D-alanyl-lipoteichoic acid acyltransferase DltB (MBOAT superfamily)
MSFFNSVEYLEITALWIAAYFAFSKYFPGRHVAFLLAMSLWWAHGFFGIPFSFLAVRLVALCIFYWAGTFFVAGRAKTIAASGLFAATIFFWLYLRFPNIMYYFDLPSPKGSEFWRHWVVYFVGVPYTVCRLISFVVDSRKGRAENPGLLRFLLYVCYFPTLLSGPVTNYSAFTRVAPSSRPRLPPFQRRPRDQTDHHRDF